MAVAVGKESKKLMPDEMKTKEDGNQQSQGSEDWRDRYLRLLAEKDNLRKRLEQNAKLHAEKRMDELIQALLPLADNLQLALELAQSEGAVDRYQEGTELILRDFLTTLSKFGVEKIEALGNPFSPDLHEAAGFVPVTDKDDGVVVKVLRAGYTRDGRLLRPAKVLVSG